MTRLSAVIGLATCLMVANASAQEAAPEPYVVKFKEGRDLLKANKYAEALEKFQESLALKASAGTMLNIGDCQEKLGRYASAVSSFEQARGLATESKNTEREKEAADRATKLSPLVSTIRVKSAGGAGDAKLSLVMDGGPIELNHPIPVDGGPHVIRAELTCKRPKDLTVTVGLKSDAQSITIDPGQMDPDPACTKAEPVKEGPSTERILSYVAGGAGVVALGFGIGFGISALGKHGDLTDACPSYPERCNISQKATLDAKYDSAHSAATISTVGFVAAVVLIGGGVALYFLSPEWKRDHKFGALPTRFAF